MARESRCDEGTASWQCAQKSGACCEICEIEDETGKICNGVACSLPGPTISLYNFHHYLYCILPSRSYHAMRLRELSLRLSTLHSVAFSSLSLRQIPSYQRCTIPAVARSPLINFCFALMDDLSSSLISPSFHVHNARPVHESKPSTTSMRTPLLSNDRRSKPAQPV